MSNNLPQKIVGLLDQSLLILMIVEILYTLQVSFREYTASLVSLDRRVVRSLGRGDAGAEFTGSIHIVDTSLSEP